MEKFVLLLENGEFAGFSQTSDTEVDLIPATLDYAEVFHSIEKAREEARNIKNGGVEGRYEIFSDYQVQAVLKVYSAE